MKLKSIKDMERQMNMDRIPPSESEGNVIIILNKNSSGTIGTELFAKG